jgi:hypothetical protein
MMPLVIDTQSSEDVVDDFYPLVPSQTRETSSRRGKLSGSLPADAGDLRVIGYFQEL